MKLFARFWINLSLIFIASSAHAADQNEPSVRIEIGIRKYCLQSKYEFIGSLPCRHILAVNVSKNATIKDVKEFLLNQQNIEEGALYVSLDDDNNVVVELDDAKTVEEVITKFPQRMWYKKDCL